MGEEATGPIRPGEHAIRGAHANKFRVVISIPPSDLDASEFIPVEHLRPVTEPDADQRSAGIAMSICVVDRVRAPML